MAMESDKGERRAKCSLFNHPRLKPSLTQCYTMQQTTKHKKGKMTPWTMSRIFLFNYDYRNIPDLNFAHYSPVYACGLYCKAAIMQRQSLFSQERCHTTPHENLVVWHWNFLAQVILLFTIKLSLMLVHYFETGNAQQNWDLKIKTKMPAYWSGWG